MHMPALKASYSRYRYMMRGEYKYADADDPYDTGGSDVGGLGDSRGAPICSVEDLDDRSKDASPARPRQMV